MRRCRFDCQIGQCYQTAYEGDYCYYHEGVKKGRLVAGENYGEDMSDE